VVGLVVVVWVLGWGCGLGRTLVFLWEHCQDGDTFVVPEVLRPFTGFDHVAR
jgi:seryl-tRNA synthetase